LESFLVLDNLSVHRSKAVRERLEGNGDTLQIFYLPIHLPELNPDKLLNAGLKQ
jgi:transposase